MLAIVTCITIGAALAAPAIPDPGPTDQDAPLRTVVRDRSDDPLDAQRNLDASNPGFATAVDLERRDGVTPADGLAEVVARTPGATVRSLGGLGQFSSVSLRGSSPQQVTVLLDGVPLGSSMAGLVDLSEIPLDTLTRVETYRGYIPISFGGVAMGGAVNLVSAPGREGHAGMEVGLGSFQARQGRAHLVQPLRGKTVLSTRLGYAGSEGDFPYLDYGTPQNPVDDTTERRRNNGYDRVVGQVRVDTRAGKWRIAAQELVAFRRQEIPGPGTAQWDETSLSSFGARTIASARRSLGRPGGRVEWVLGLGGTHRRFRDPDNAVGLAVDNQVTRGVDSYVSPRLRLALWKGAFLGLMADQRTEWVDVDERAVPSPTGDGTRVRVAFGAGIQIEQFLFERRWVLVPGYRADALDSRFRVPAGAGEPSDEGRNQVQVGHSPRLGTRLRIVDGLELRGSIGRYFRPPTLTELFGDRGFAVGNEGLRPERGTSADGGLSLDRPLGAKTHLYAQAAGFWMRSEDLIQWVNAGLVTRPENLADARVAGLETGLRLSTLGDDVTLSAAYTFLDARNLDPDPTRRDQPLPGRPRHQLFARLAGGHAWMAGTVELEPRLFYDLELVGSTYLDLSGRLELPTRLFHAVGVQMAMAHRVVIAFEVRNLLDNRTTSWSPPVANVDGRIDLPISDFIGYPLPGRSLWASLRVHLPQLRARREAA